MTVMTKKVWGWIHFDWASQPYHTLITTFIFAPYFASAVVADPVKGQELWGWMLTLSGLLIAALAPILGALADSSGSRVSWILGFSTLYLVGSFALWWAIPEADNVTVILLAAGIALVGVEFATIFTNAMLPDLGSKKDVGLISGIGWAYGYCGGIVALAIMLLLFAENAEGVTLLGNPPFLGLDPETREGTRLAGPLTTVWYVVFMIPFFAWAIPLRDAGSVAAKGAAVAHSTVAAASKGISDLWHTLRHLPRDRSLSAFLLSSMFYRDAINGIAAFGGIYAVGVLGWSVVQIGIFGIVAALSGAIFAWAGGHADRRFGPKPVIQTTIIVLTLVCMVVITVSREQVLLIPVDATSSLPDIVFYICGALIGACTGSMQAASRTMVVRQANPDRMTEAFGLYALCGKATSFLAPFLIATATLLSGDQRLGVSPLILLFIIGLVLLRWVNPDREAG